MHVSALSDVGLIRKNNEDSFYVCAPHLFVVADGMGGHEAGEVASSLAVASIQEYVFNNVATKDKKDLLREAISEANRRIYAEAISRQGCQGMGTTVSAAYLQDDVLYWGHVGDSRIYLICEGVGELLTDDHSLVWQLMKQGELSLEEANSHPRRNVLTRAVGTEPEAKIDVGRRVLMPGDQVLLCTDGLTNLLTGEEIAAAATASTDPDETVKYLIELAKNRGGFDNITIILIDNR